MSSLISHLKKIVILSATVVIALLGVIEILSLSGSHHALAVFDAPVDSLSLPEYIITVNNTGTLSVIDARTDIVYGPFLSGTLGTVESGGGIFDIVVTPDGNKALVSNFGDQKIIFVDFSNPISPSFITTVTMPMFAEDIAMSRDGRFALVTDGGFSPNVSTIDVFQMTLAYTGAFTNGMSANAVAIGAYNTVVTADYFLGGIHALSMDANGQLTYTHAYTYTQNLDGTILSQTVPADAMQAIAARPRPLNNSASPDTAQSIGAVDGPLGDGDYHLPRPVNIAISPDGQTVLVPDSTFYNSMLSNGDPALTQTLYSVGVYLITAPGELQLTGVITNLNRATQSIAFSPAGDKAYLSGNGGLIDPVTSSYPAAQLSVLDILGPGQVRLAADGVVDYPRFQGGQLFGVDTIAVANGKAYLGHPTLSGITPYLRVINLSDYSVKRLSIPMSVGVARMIKLRYLPIIYRY